MTQVHCDECLRIYKPYTYSETLQRALVSGVDKWKRMDSIGHITRRFHKLLYNRHSPYWIKGALRNSFPSVNDFTDCQRHFNIERRAKMSATFLCFDCEKYLCDKCITQHSEHFTFSKDDKNNVDKWDEIETKIIQAFNTEGGTKEEQIKQERVFLSNVVDVSDSISEGEWEEFMTTPIKNGGHALGIQLGIPCPVLDICILNDNQTFIVINNFSTRIKLYNIGSYELIDTIELPYRPGRITEIPSTNPSQSLIAVSFDNKRRINIMNIQLRPVDVIYSFKVQGKCRDLVYCNNKLITVCGYYLDREWRDSIHVMDMKGDIINIIDLNKLLHTGFSWTFEYRLSVHSESETIYMLHSHDRVTSLSLTGQVLHSTRLTDPYPVNIYVDNDKNIYYMIGHSLALYRLSSDLSEKVEIINKDAAAAWRSSKSIVHHKNKIYIVSGEGQFYIYNVD